MKIKLESSKHNYSSNEEYIKAIFDKTSILLDKNKKCYKPGRRAIVKTYLNKLWGKLGQGQKMKKLNLLLILNIYIKYYLIKDKKTSI